MNEDPPATSRRPTRPVSSARSPGAEFAGAGAGGSAETGLGPGRPRRPPPAPPPRMTGTTPPALMPGRPASASELKGHSREPYGVPTDRADRAGVPAAADRGADPGGLPPRLRCRGPCRLRRRAGSGHVQQHLPRHRDRAGTAGDPAGRSGAGTAVPVRAAADAQRVRQRAVAGGDRVADAAGDRGGLVAGGDRPRLDDPEPARRRARPGPRRRLPALGLAWLLPAAGRDREGGARDRAAHALR